MEIFDYNLFADKLFESLWWFQDGAGPHRTANSQLVVLILLLVTFSYGAILNIFLTGVIIKNY